MNENHPSGQSVERRDDVHGPALQNRIERASRLAAAIGDAHPQDAEAVCLAFLSDREIGSPGVPLFDVRLDDARWWISSASLPEVAAYTLAGLERIGQAALPIGVRKRALVALWRLLPVVERRAFIARVDAAGAFTGGAAR